MAGRLGRGEGGEAVLDAADPSDPRPLPDELHRPNAWIRAAVEFVEADALGRALAEEVEDFRAADDRLVDHAGRCPGE